MGGEVGGEVGNSSPPGGWPLSSGSLPGASSPCLPAGGWGAQLMPSPREHAEAQPRAWRRGGGGARVGRSGRAEAEREAAAGARSVPDGHWALWPGFGIG